MTTSTIERPAVQATGRPEAIVCHLLDDYGRPVCGASTKGHRDPHNYASCLFGEHSRCVTCESLFDLVAAGRLEGVA